MAAFYNLPSFLHFLSVISICVPLNTFTTTGCNINGISLKIDNSFKYGIASLSSTNLVEVFKCFEFTTFYSLFLVT